MTEMHVPKRIRPQVQPPPLENTDRASWVSSPSASSDQLVIDAVAPVPTEHGTFLMYVFRWLPDGAEHVAMVRGDLAGKRGVPVRVHSECLTSEVFHSLKCDCREQLHAALEEIARREEGVLLYLRQEGRGIGLANKIRAYALQAHGADTVDANRMLGLPDDARRYDMAALMLRHLEIESIRLMTNNPQKVEELRALGVEVDDRIPHVVTPSPYAAGYLEAKRVRMRHHLPQFTRPSANSVVPIERPSTNSVVPLERPSLTGTGAE
jgi:GTP cyclohydrolase II